MQRITWTWVVQGPSERADRALLKAIESQQGNSNGNLPHLTRSQLQRLMEEGHVTVDGTPCSPSTKLREGASVQIDFPPPTPMDLAPEARPLEILFEDEHLVVVNKPQDLTVHPAPSQMTGTLVHALLHHIDNLSGIGGALRPGIVHRIDKNTSGALVITKTDLAHDRLSKDFAKHEIERTYWALCYGSPPTAPSAQGFTRIESLLGRHPTDRKKMSMQVKGGKKAVTHYRTLEKYGLPQKNPFASWLEVTLETGRTHQVRVHLTGIGHSLLGDPTYGTVSPSQAKWKALPHEIQQRVLALPGQALHAYRLGFRHPVTQERLRFEAPPPQPFQNLLTALRRFHDH